MVKFQEEWQKIAFGALLHDIGKFIHRHDEYRKSYPQLGTQHQALSVWFYKELVNYKIVEDDEIVTTVIQRHHEDSRIAEQFRVQEIKDINLKQLALLVSRADNYSSNERGDEEAEYGKHSGTFRTTPLQSVFSRVSISKKDKISSFFKLKPFESDEIFSSTTHKENHQNDLKLLIDGFLNESFKINPSDFNSLFNTMLVLIEKYTWCIASDTQSGINDIPLYDHLKTTSAIALSSYRYQMEFDKVTQKRIKDGNEELQFLVIGGDLSGIQSFIYNLGANKSGAKRLRARSFYIKTLSEVLSYRIIKDLELTPAHIVLQAGGKFHIIAPNTEDTTTKLKLIEKELTKELYNEFKGDIFIALDCVETSGKALNGQYNDITEDLETKLTKKKKTKFSKEVLNNPIFENPIYADGQGASLCPVCQKEIHNTGEICSTCQKQINIGTKLPNIKYLAITNNGKGDFSFLGLGVKLIKDLKDVPERELFLLVNLKEETTVGVYPEIRGSYGGDIPKNSDGETMEFETIAEGSTGVKNLGVLIADVDNLGDIFSRGLGDAQSISRVANMSKLIDTFFSKFIEDSIIKGRNKAIDYKGVKINLSKFYLVYSGGDDLLIVAPWNELIFFSKWLNDKFKEFTNNPDFTVSCGLHIMNPSDPFYIASEEAGHLEELAKTSGKNGLAIWEKYIPWDKFDEVFISYGEKFSEYNNDEIYTQSFLYRLLKYTEMAEKYFIKKDVWQLSFISKFNYDVERNLKEKIIKKFSGNIESIPQWKLIKKSFYLLKDDNSIDSEGLDFLGKYMRVALNYAVRKNRKGDK